MSGIVIVDLGTGNLRSVSKALAHVCADSGTRYRVSISAEPSEIKTADHLILPGQGALGPWMKRLGDDSMLRAAVMTRLQQGPVLGICLGLQALYHHSMENGGTAGFGLFDGTVRHFNGDDDGNAKAVRGLPQKSQAIKIPHMGWNNVRHTRDHPLWHGIEDQQRFYFVHSYFVDSARCTEVVGTCEYDTVFTAAAARDNIFATQFHPEKSQHAGLQMLKNFVNWNGDF